MLGACPIYSVTNAWFGGQKSMTRAPGKNMAEMITKGTIIFDQACKMRCY